MELDKIANMTQGDLRRFIVNLLHSDPGAVPESLAKQLQPGTYIGDVLRWDGYKWIPARHEKWHYVGDANEPAFVSPWVNFDTPTVYRPAAFYKDAAGIVHLRGIVASGTTGAGDQTIFTLPYGYRPRIGKDGVGDLIGIVFSTMCWNGGNAVFGSINIRGNGTVSTYSGNVYGANTGIWLDNIHFRAEQ